ncbi:hypothetical protein CsSME_00006876 [Camellia sinensis var. sinensis]
MYIIPAQGRMLMKSSHFLIYSMVPSRARQGLPIRGWNRKRRETTSKGKKNRRNTSVRNKLGNRMLVQVRLPQRKAIGKSRESGGDDRIGTSDKEDEPARL